MTFEEIRKTDIKHSCGIYLYETHIKKSDSEYEIVSTCNRCKKVFDIDKNNETELKKYKELIYGS